MQLKSSPALTALSTRSLYVSAGLVPQLVLLMFMLPFVSDCLTATVSCFSRLAVGLDH